MNSDIDTGGSDDAGPRSHRAGEWFGIFGEQAVVALPPTEKGRVAALWEIVDDGADFDDVLDALVATGLRSLPGFALLGTDPAATRVILRGSPRAEFTLADGTVEELSGESAGGTWVERTFADVTASVVVLEDAAEGADLQVARGLARISRINDPAPSPAAAAPPEAAAVEEEPAPAPDEVADEAPVAAAGGPVLAAVPNTSWNDAEGSADQAQPEVEPAAMDAPEEAADHPEPEPVMDSGAEGGATQAFAPYDDEQSADPFAKAPEQPSATPAWGQAAEPEPAPEPSAPQAGAAFGWGQAGTSTDAPANPFDQSGQSSQFDAGVDHDGQTRAGGYDPEQFARPQQGIPGQPQAPSVTARPVARLTFSHGETAEVDRVVLIGRAPEARRFTTTDQPRLVTVPSPNQEISSTHLEVRPGSGADHGSAVVTDMGSTNGTVLVQPGLSPEDLQPGIGVQLIPGAVIDLGDGLTIQVSNP